MKPVADSAKLARREADLKMMHGIAAGDLSSFQQFYDTHAPLVYGIARRILRNLDDVDELVEDVFFEIWHKSARFDATRASPTTYLVTLTRSRCIDRQRRRGHRPFVSLPTAERADPKEVRTPADHAAVQEERDEVRLALSKLEPDQRSAIEAAYLDGLSQSEIAQKLGRPLGTIKTHVRQGLIRLRELMRNKEKF